MIFTPLVVLIQKVLPTAEPDSQESNLTPELNRAEHKTFKPEETGKR
jgi:hypothetical protein